MNAKHIEKIDGSTLNVSDVSSGRLPGLSWTAKDNEPIITTHSHAFGKTQSSLSFTTRFAATIAQTSRRANVTHSCPPRDIPQAGGGEQRASAAELADSRSRPTAAADGERLCCVGGFRGLSRKWVQRLTRTRGSCLTRCSFPLLISGNQMGGSNKVQIRGCGALSRFFFFRCLYFTRFFLFRTTLHCYSLHLYKSIYSLNLCFYSL